MYKYKMIVAGGVQNCFYDDKYKDSICYGDFCGWNDMAEYKECKECPRYIGNLKSSITKAQEKIAKEIANAVDYNIYCLAKYHRNNFYNFCREHNIKDYKNKRKEVINEYEKLIKEN